MNITKYVTYINCLYINTHKHTSTLSVLVCQHYPQMND